MKVGINSDMGEGFGNYSICDDEALMGIVSSANVACGFHAGDPIIMDRMLRLAKARGVEVGAHPGLPDLLGFGRSDHACALESSRCWRAVVFCPISLRFGYVLARRGHGGPQEHDERAPDETAGDGCHGFLVTRSLLMG